MDTETNTGREGAMKITVTGEGTAVAIPDMATAIVGVRTEKGVLQEAQLDNAKIANDMIASLLRLGLMKEDLKTADYRIDPIYSYEGGKQEFQGYRVTNLFSITIRNVGNLGRVIDTAVRSGANEVMNIQFAASDQKAYYQHALSLAVMDSDRKAKTIAATIGKANQLYPLSMTEENRMAVPVPRLTASFEGSAGSTPIEPGKLEINAAVTAIYIVK